MKIESLDVLKAQKQMSEANVSFLENENEMVIDATYSEIGAMLVEDWVNANLDEGQLYADYRFAEMSDSNYLKGRFNLFYDLNAGDQYYLECEEE
jgi:hypothetical protein